jgi:hypothetical protein
LVEADTCSLVVKGVENPRLMHDPEAVLPPIERVDFGRVHGRQRKSAACITKTITVLTAPDERKEFYE